jgi:hypothetical protein
MRICNFVARTFFLPLLNNSTPIHMFCQPAQGRSLSHIERLSNLARTKSLAAKCLLEPLKMTFTTGLFGTLSVSPVKRLHVFE